MLIDRCGNINYEVKGVITKNRTRIKPTNNI